MFKPPTNIIQIKIFKKMDRRVVTIVMLDMKLVVLILLQAHGNVMDDALIVVVGVPCSEELHKY